MKPLTVTIRAIRSFDRSIGFYAEIDAPDNMGKKDKIFFRSSRKQVENLVARLLSANVERKNW